MHKALGTLRPGKRRLMVALCALAVVAFNAPSGTAAGLRSHAVHSPAAKPQITIGSKNFTEQLLVGNMEADLLQAAGYPVVRKLNLAGTAVCQAALVRGDIDTYVEYTGTGLTTILKLPTINNPAKVYKVVKKQYAKQYHLEWLKTWGFNDTYAMIMTKAEATKYNVKTLSDLAKVSSSLVIGGTQEFLARPDDGLPGMSKAYNMSFKDQKGLDPGLLYQALTSGQVDVASGFSTDGQISADHLVVIKDNKRYFPPYYAAPVVRQQTLKKSPGIAKILNKLAGKLSNKEMAKLNYAVEGSKKDPAAVAKAFLKQIHLIK
ncbi:MAG: glycine betaine ABC transporter substrate-binding protein [Chloroflexota bacterium]